MLSSDIKYITAALRRAFSSHPSRLQAIYSARRGLKYECAHCHRLFSRSGIECDHIVPVGGFDSWSGYISRLFVSSDKLQVLCVLCHKKKTKTQMDPLISLAKRKRLDLEMTPVQRNRMERHILEFSEVFD